MQLYMSCRPLCQPLASQLWCDLSHQLTLKIITLYSSCEFIACEQIFNATNWCVPIIAHKVSAFVYNFRIIFYFDTWQIFTICVHETEPAVRCINCWLAAFNLQSFLISLSAMQFFLLLCIPKIGFEFKHMYCTACRN